MQESRICKQENVWSQISQYFAVCVSGWMPGGCTILELRGCFHWMQYASFWLAICVILPCNMRHITLQYASYQAPICHLWHPKRWLLRLRSIFSGCRKCLFTTFSLVEWRKMLMSFCQNNSHFFFRVLLLISYLSFHELENWRIILQSHSRQSRRLRQTIPKTHFWIHEILWFKFRMY